MREVTTESLTQRVISQLFGTDESIEHYIPTDYEHIPLLKRVLAGLLGVPLPSAADLTDRRHIEAATADPGNARAQTWPQMSFDDAFDGPGETSELRGEHRVLGRSTDGTSYSGSARLPKDTGLLGQGGFVQTQELAATEFVKAGHISFTS